MLGKDSLFYELIMFTHCPPKALVELTTESVNNKRFYVTPEGSFPSITSVLGSFPKPALMEWRVRVGADEANRVTKLATSRGTKLHSLCEHYLNNEVIDTKKYMPDVLSAFYGFKPLLHNINDIHYQEAPLYSTKLKVAGRVDVLASYNNTFSVIDFKTSKKEKREDWIQDYFLQCCYYSLSYYELTGILAKQIVILIAVEDGKNQEFIRPTKDYVKPLIKKINEYYRLYHT